MINFHKKVKAASATYYFDFMRNSIVILLKGYKIFISPLLPKSCRFYPTCSDYVSLVVRYHNSHLGLFLGLYRIFSCHPFSKGGIDYPFVKLKIYPIFTSPKKMQIWFVPIRKKILFTNGWFLVIPSLGAYNEKK